MTPNEQALYAEMEGKGYSYGLCMTALRLLSGHKSEIDDVLLFISDNNPDEEELVIHIAELCSGQTSTRK